jgi:hypothetical protein
MRSILSVLCAVVLLGPARAQDVTKDTNLYPLKKGSKWTYNAGTDTVLVLVKESKKVGMDEEFELETSVGGMPVASEHIIVKPEGVFRVKVGNVAVVPPVLFLKLPAKNKEGKPTGESWTVNSKVGSDTLSGKFTIGGEEITIEKPAKTKYQTITVSGPELLANGQKMKLTYYFAENMGMVKQVASIAGVDVVLELLKYEPGKD